LPALQTGKIMLRGRRLGRLFIILRPYCTAFPASFSQQDNSEQWNDFLLSDVLYFKELVSRAIGMARTRMAAGPLEDAAPGNWAFDRHGESIRTNPYIIV
jgi:hypothetical protein